MKPEYYDALVGRKFGMLTIRSVAMRKTRYGRVEAWASCRCDCGALHDTRMSPLKMGQVGSCGCRRGGRGFATMTKAARTNVARRGGHAVVAERGASYMAEIGKRGGEVRAARARARRGSK